MLERMIMKQKILALCMITLVIISCNFPSFVTPAPEMETPSVVPTNTIISTGGLVTLNNVSFRLPLGVANDARTEMVSAVTDPNNAPWWEIAPDHLKFTLTGYQLQDKSFEPQILVYPTDEYAQLGSTTIAAEQIQRLKTILTGSPLSRDVMPHVPTFNASPRIASHMQVISFQSGRGIRMLTQYDQYPATINNHELFYHFQGLTQDGKYYIVAVLPATASILAEDDKPDSPVPAEGVAVPTETGPDPAYYEAVTKALDSMYEDSFNPSLFQLDALIQSITVTP
jgi:hypothetical protein